MIDDSLRDDLLPAVKAALGETDEEKGRARLIELGWLDLLEADLPTAIEVVFRQQGAFANDLGAADDLILQSLSAAEWTSRSDVAVAHPTPESTVEGAGGVSHVVHRARRNAEYLVLPTRTPDGTTLRLVPAAKVLDIAAPVAGAPGLLGIPSDKAREFPVEDQIAGARAAAFWPAAVSAMRVALSWQLVGAGEAMLDLTSEHARNRVQYGRPIANYQTIRHKLAECRVELSAAAAVTSAATQVLTTHSANTAKVSAGQAAMTVAKHSRQILGGIGWTVEHPFHRYEAMTRTLEVMYGSTRDLRAVIGKQLATVGHSANLIELWQIPCVHA